MGNLKVGCIKNKRHLKSSIDYIFDNTKTDNGRYIFGDSGFNSEEVKSTFNNTKEIYGKTDGRQAYHFILTFGNDENVSPDTAQEITERFMEKYFSDDGYDWCAAVHNDKAHMHSHIIFNSVNRNTGYKYRYEKGDWEKYIQRIVDELCNEYNLKTIEYDFSENGEVKKKNKPKKNDRAGSNYEKNNPDAKSKADLIRQDIDRYINQSNSYEDFLNLMRKDGYSIHEGTSEKYGSYITFKPYGFPKGVRSYRLGDEYTVVGLKRRILLHEKKIVSNLTDKQISRFIKLSNIPVYSYRKYYAKHIYIAVRWKNKKPFPNSYKYKKDVVELNKTIEEYNLLKITNFQNVNDVMNYKSHLKQRIRESYLLKSNAKSESDINSYKEEIIEYKRQIKICDRIRERIETFNLQDNLSRSTDKNMNIEIER